MRVEVAAVLAFAVDQQVVAVEDRVIAASAAPAVADRDQLGPAGGDDVEALVGAAAAARRAEFADRPRVPCGPWTGKTWPEVRHAAVAGWTISAEAGAASAASEKDEGEEGRALQWCSITRSTMLYSFASSALMK